MHNSIVSISIPTAKFLKLADFLRVQGSECDPVEAVSYAIDYWVDNLTWKQEDLKLGISTENKGYTWKSLFLPHGTKLRMKYKGQYSYSQIISDELIFDDSVLSPSEFASKVAGSNRNAWRYLELRRRGDNEWINAGRLRQEVEDEEYTEYMVKKFQAEEALELKYEQLSFEEVISQVISGTYEEQRPPMEGTVKLVLIERALSLLKKDDPLINKVRSELEKDDPIIRKVLSEIESLGDPLLRKVLSELKKDNPSIIKVISSTFDGKRSE